MEELSHWSLPDALHRALYKVQYLITIYNYWHFRVREQRILSWNLLRSRWYQASF